jgi:uncharacterized membrane protein YphA (DoxX/SURF4 family)
VAPDREPGRTEDTVTTLTTTHDTPRPVFARRSIRGLAPWAVQAVLALQFAAGGMLKISGNPEMVDMFATIGAGQWFRYAVGVLEIAGAIGLLIPRLCGLAALGLAALMTGAVITNIAFLDTSPALPAAFLVVAALIAWIRRAGITAFTTRRTS